MPDYSAQKVAELKDLLKQRSLPTSGNKQELVARLQESDGKPAAAAASSGTCAANHDFDQVHL